MSHINNVFYCWNKMRTVSVSYLKQNLVNKNGGVACTSTLVPNINRIHWAFRGVMSTRSFIVGNNDNSLIPKTSKKLSYQIALVQNAHLHFNTIHDTKYQDPSSGFRGVASTKLFDWTDRYLSSPYPSIASKKWKKYYSIRTRGPFREIEIKVHGLNIKTENRDNLQTQYRQ